MSSIVSTGSLRHNLRLLNIIRTSATAFRHGSSPTEKWTALCSQPYLVHPATRAVTNSSRANSSATISPELNSVTNEVSISAKRSNKSRPMRQIPTSALLRNIMLSSVFASPMLTRLGMSTLRCIAESRSPLLDPDRNLILNRIIRATIYNHFCAGTNTAEIAQCVKKIKATGVSNVILNYGKEIVNHQLAETPTGVDISAQQIPDWREANLKSIGCIAADDYLAIKYTGAGGSVVEALKTGNDPPEQFSSALSDVCEAAKARGARVMVDAEQQVYQPTIDLWTVDLMRKYNKDDNAVVLNTYQTYLKQTRKVIHEHLILAQKEGWTLGIKQVRGAYILNEIRDRIHDTKEDTDANYDGIARDLLSRSFNGIQGDDFPTVRLFLAGHNATSIRKAAKLQKQLVLQGKSRSTLELGQLYGMADHISGELVGERLRMKEQCRALSEAEANTMEKATPRVVKCVNWASVRECLYFLMRRATENQGSTDRLHDVKAESKRELWARMYGFGG